MTNTVNDKQTAKVVSPCLSSIGQYINFVIGNVQLQGFALQLTINIIIMFAVDIIFL